MEISTKLLEISKYSLFPAKLIIISKSLVSGRQYFCCKYKPLLQFTFDDDGYRWVPHNLCLLLELLLSWVHELPLQHVLAPAPVGAVSLVILDTGNVMLCYDLSTSCVMSCRVSSTSFLICLT